MYFGHNARGKSSNLKFKYWVDNEASKFRDLEIYSKGGEPYFKFYNKKGMVLDEMILSRYDSEEINKILIGFGQKYVPDLTWKM